MLFTRNRLAVALSLLLVSPIVFAGASEASLIGASANVEEIAAPRSTIQGELESWNVRIFQEQTNVLLTDPVYLDILDPGNYEGLGAGYTSNGYLATGIRVDSWMIHLDQPGSSNPGSVVTGYVEFSSDILGLAVFPGAFPQYGDPATLINTDALLGSPTTAYASYALGNAGYFRGLEHLGNGDEFAARDSVVLSADRRRLDFTMRNVHDGTDQIRIVMLSTIPEPGTGLLVMIGLTGLSLRARTRRA